MVYASTKQEAGSGFQETNLGSCLSLLAKRSISGVSQWVVICVKISLFKVHSVQSLNNQDSLSASAFSTQAMQVAVKQVLLFTHQSLMSYAS